MRLSLLLANNGLQPTADRKCAAAAAEAER
jgi:hypothetical protein